ncbi:MAG: nucleoside triphosphate pyrophosphohydrolase [Candidatus Thorarchaeota archaeon]
MKDKLVRDKIPEIIREKGGDPSIRVAGKDELDVLLREKIVEEAQEFLMSGDFGELIDILEALDAIMELRKADPAFIEIQHGHTIHTRECKNQKICLDFTMKKIRKGQSSQTLKATIWSP